MTITLTNMITMLKMIDKDLVGLVVAVLLVIWLLLRYMRASEERRDCEWHETLRASFESSKAAAESLSQLKGLMEALIPLIIKGLGGKQGD